MIHRSPLPDVEIPDLPLTSYVLAGGQKDKPALIDGASGQALTYADLETAVRSLAGGLVANLGERAAGDEGLPQQPAGDGRDDRFRRVATHR